MISFGCTKPAEPEVHLTIAMEKFRAVLALLSILGMAKFGEAFKPNLPPLKDATVLVVGASGQVGELVSIALQEQYTLVVDGS